MVRHLRLAAALLFGLALPAFAQTAAPSGTARSISPPRPSVAAPSVPATPAKVDINSATEAQLDTLPGIGPARAKAIVAGRPYDDLQALVGKKVLTQPVFDAVRDRLALANINTSTAALMQKTLPGVGDVRARAIVAGRPYAAPQDLVAKGVLTQGVFDGMKGLVSY